VWRHFVHACLGGGAALMLVQILPARPAWLANPATTAVPIGAMLGLWLCHELHRYREYLWKELPGPPWWLRQYIEQHTPELVALGFQQEGDFRLRGFPMPTFVRLFTSDDGETIGLLESVGHIQSIAFQTVFEDGSALETSNAITTAFKQGLSPQGKHLWFNLLTNATAAQAYASHRGIVQHCSRLSRAAPISFSRDAFRLPVNHIHRINFWQMFEEGLVSPPRLAGRRYDPQANGA
jgi:hypothetical protein